MTASTDLHSLEQYCQNAATVYIPRPRTYEAALRCARDAFPALRSVPDHGITFLTHWRLHGKRLKWQTKPIVIPDFTWTTIVPVMAQGLAIVIYVHPAAASGAGRRRRSMPTPESTPPESPVIVSREVEPLSVHESTVTRPVPGAGPGTEHEEFATPVTEGPRGDSPFTRDQSPYAGEHTPFAGPSRTHTSFSRSRHGTPEHGHD